MTTDKSQHRTRTVENGKALIYVVQETPVAQGSVPTGSGLVACNVEATSLLRLTQVSATPVPSPTSVYGITFRCTS